MSSKTKKFRSRAAASSSDEEEGGGEATTVARPTPGAATAKKKPPAAAPAKKASALLSFDDDDEEDEGGALQALKSKKKKALSSKKPLRKALEEHLDDRAADEGAPAPAGAASAGGEYSKEKLAALKKSQHFQVSTKAVRETDRTTRVRFEVPEDAVVAGGEGDEEEDAELGRAKVEQLKKEKRRKDALLAGHVPGQEDEESYIPLDGSLRGPPTDGKGKVRTKKREEEGKVPPKKGHTTRMR